MTWDIEKAKKYFLLPFKSPEARFYIGGEKKLLALEMVMNEKDLMFSFMAYDDYSKQTDKEMDNCFLTVNKNEKECKELLDQAKTILKIEQEKSIY